MRPVVVVSPHLDDAVLSTGQYLAGRGSDVTIVTLFAGVPAAGVVTEYDRKCGFVDSRDAVTTRRTEDVEACALLNIAPVHLSYLDHQYGAAYAIEAGIDMVDALVTLIDGLDPEYVLGPLGLLHPDHVMTRNVTMAAAISTPVILYEELPYRVTHPELVTEVIAGIRAADTTMGSVFIGTGSLARKLSALWCYRSQTPLPEFANLHDVLVRERFWHATP